MSLHSPLSTNQIDVIDSLSTHQSFFVREAIANFIVNNPQIIHLDIAKRLSEDQHTQVSRRGKEALSIINKVRFGSL